MLPLTETEKAYLAGIFDGEGSIGYYKKKINGYHTPQCQISNTDPRILKWLQEKVSFGCIGFSKRTKYMNYNWICWGNSDVIAFLTAIQPFLVVKRDQADLLLSLLSTEQELRGGKMSRRLSNEDLAKRDAVALELKRLKTASYISAH